MIDPEALEAWPSGGVRVAFGRRGARAAAARGDAVVLVDVLSFSTTVALAVARGAWVVPCGEGEDAAALARAHGARGAASREEAGQGLSLSPASAASLGPGEGVVLPSPNGSTCARLAAAGGGPVALGALVNARAVAASAAAWLAANPTRALSVIACGERWRSPDPDDGALRVAVEDLLGVGAVVSRIGAPKSADALFCQAAFAGLADRLEAVLAAATSGRELIARGFAQDVALAARLDAVGAVPVLGPDGVLRAGSLEAGPGWRAAGPRSSMEGEAP